MYSWIRKGALAETLFLGGCSVWESIMGSLSFFFLCTSSLPGVCIFVLTVFVSVLDELLLKKSQNSSAEVLN